MTRQYYELIAETVRGLPENPTKLQVALAFTETLENESGRFKANKFMEACGINYPTDDKETMDAQDILSEMKVDDDSN